MLQEFMYRRASTESADRHTLEQQETACRNYCETNGLTLVDIFRETGKGTQQEPGTSPAEHREEK
ncbi:hypothetical protein EPA93_04030 [Ktedonosporobacter rubrisoli]|uniref:Resolvase/invertase-type recombinase catalytic domain-containing protein n=1 Tax=Ktedonosporobacter rubrisoli TaxID=2509675 RepID=A0A4P6JKM5_KTERU|nr:recombinase family protein [Ktedonosporobacter rubrisoli]QBD75206.1 hypothetical protein EPA93_04030 [Ktedonosporobacter rubrisoli]